MLKSATKKWPSFPLEMLPCRPKLTNLSAVRELILILYWPGSILYMQYLLNKFFCKVKFIIFVQDSYYH